MSTDKQVPTNEQLAADLIDLMTHDSENLDRTLAMMADDCIWVMEPGGTEYYGKEEIQTFAGIAMSLRTHDNGENRMEVTNHFISGDQLCLEYSHGMVGTNFLTKLLVTGFRGKIRTGVTRYCMVYHIREGKFDSVHEYINTTSVWQSLMLPIGMNYLHWASLRKLAKKRRG